MSANRSIDPETTSAGPRVAWGLYFGTFLCLTMGLAASMPLALCLAAASGCCGLVFHTSGTIQSTGHCRSWLLLIAWFVMAAPAAMSFVSRAVSEATWLSSANAWMLFVGYAAVLFITQRVTRELKSLRADLSPLLTELWFMSLLVALTTFGNTSRASVPVYVAELAIRIWSLGIAVEGLLRLTMAALSGRSAAEALAARFLLRQLLLDDRFAGSSMDGVNRDFVHGQQLQRANSGRAAIAVGILLTLITAWMLSGLVIVRTGDLAAYYRLGILQKEMLGPGIHLTLPSPLARTSTFSSQRLRAATVGFVADLQKISGTPMLWTRTHGEAELPLIVGDGTELVAINAVVHYRVADSDEGRADFVKTARDPDGVVRKLAQHVLMADTRTKTLQGLLETDRSVWGQQIQAHLQDDVAQLRLGLEIVQLDVLSIHPPIEVAESFLDIVTARVDAEREIVEARGAYLSERSRCEMMSATESADAKAAASVRITGVMDEKLYLEALVSGYEQHPNVFRRRAFCNAIGEALADRSFTLIDSGLPAGLKLWIGGQREIHPEAIR